MPLPPLCLDECIDRRLAHTLRARGVDVVTVAEVATASHDDEAQLLYETSQSRVLVSQNQIDLRRLHAQFRRGEHPHGGIMLDWLSTFPEHTSQLFSWNDLQQRIIHGYRRPDWNEDVVREAVGWH